MLRALTEAVEHIAEILTAAADLVPVYAATDPGYGILTPPCLAVDAPTITNAGAYLDRSPLIALTVPIRVIPSTAPDGAGLITLTDKTLTALRLSGVSVTECRPIVSPVGAGTPAAMPAYRITAEVQIRQ